MIRKSLYVQPYRGPFTLDEADAIMRDLKQSPLFSDVIARQRGETNEWDILIKLNEDNEHDENA